jgi:alkylation response protein AidB-like acyl-CoA dehydrogenase
MALQPGSARSVAPGSLTKSAPAPLSYQAYEESPRRQSGETGAEFVLISRRPLGHLPAETAIRSTITQIYEGTNQIQRMVMARQLLNKGT